MNAAAIQLKERHGTVKRMLLAASDQLAMLLGPSGMQADRYRVIACNVLAREPHLLTCAPVSLVQTIIKGAELGLEFAPALGQAYIVPFWNSRKREKVATLIPGYRGYVKLALESPRYASIDADLIRNGDDYVVERGTAPRLVHSVSLAPAADRAVVAAYAVAHMTNGAPPLFALVRQDELNAIRQEALDKITDRDAAKQRRKREMSPWTRHEGEMQKKTAIRRLAKFLEVSARLSRAMALDDEWDRNQRLGGERTEALKNKLRADAAGEHAEEDAIDVDAEPLDDAVEEETNAGDR